jgi:hypothetical protein
MTRTDVGVAVAILAGCNTHPASTAAAKHPQTIRHSRKTVMGCILTSNDGLTMGNADEV